MESGQTSIDLKNLPQAHERLGRMTKLGTSFFEPNYSSMRCLAQDLRFHTEGKFADIAPLALDNPN